MAGRDEEKGGGKLPADARAMIGAHLRRMYDNVVSEPISTGSRCCLINSRRARRLVQKSRIRPTSPATPPARPDRGR